MNLLADAGKCASLEHVNAFIAMRGDKTSLLPNYFGLTITTLVLSAVNYSAHILNSLPLGVGFYCYFSPNKRGRVNM